MTRSPVEGAELGEPIQLFRVARARGVELGDELRHVGEDGSVHARAEHLARDWPEVLEAGLLVWL